MESMALIPLRPTTLDEAMSYCAIAARSDFWPGHFERLLPRLPAFFSKILIAHNGCWLWLGFVSQEGYGHFSIARRTIFAHRFIVEATRGPIPSGFVVDHICRTRHCVRPDHLDVTTHRINLLRGNTVNAAGIRKTHCIANHPFTLENTYSRKDDHSRGCRICRREARRRCDAKRINK